MLLSVLTYSMLSLGCGWLLVETGRRWRWPERRALGRSVLWLGVFWIAATLLVLARAVPVLLHD